MDNTTGIATGNQPESIFAVMSGTHWNDGCCFDYGNSETDDKNDGCATMEAIYFGNASWHGNRGAGKGPWLGADLEQGMCKPRLCRFAPLCSAARAHVFATTHH